jgi:very-short-patch-repair endonuclease
MASFEKETYITRAFQKLSGKRWELYVVTRVVHLLNDPDIEYVCQQYINPPQNKSYYLADLAFPSLKLYLEIDEGQHSSELHKRSDARRDAEILEATDWECKRISVEDKKIDLINREIDDFVSFVVSKKNSLIRQGNKITWNYNEKFQPEFYMKKRRICVQDNVSLLSHRDVLRLFGYKKGHFQRGVWHIKGFNEMVWFPKLYPNSGWENSFNKDTNTITEHKKDLSEIGPPSPNDQLDRVVFAHQKNVFGQTVYKFYGIFRTDLTRSNNVYHYHNRVEECIDLIKYQ